MTTQPLHTAIIMDGNGRWALARGLPRTAGHQQGAKAVKRIVQAAPELGIRVLTLYAFSSDNWCRPRPEVDFLMRQLERFLRSEKESCIDNGVRLSVIGRRDRLKRRMVEAIERVETATEDGTRLHLRLAVDYSARAAIASAASHVASCSLSHDHFAHHLNAVIHSSPAAPDVDLLIRTGGEKRLSDFLLWECAYAELLFSDCMWPDFDATDLAMAVEDFGRRQRRFGLLPPDPGSWAIEPPTPAQPVAAE